MLLTTMTCVVFAILFLVIVRDGYLLNPFEMVAAVVFPTHTATTAPTKLISSPVRTPGWTSVPQSPTQYGSDELDNKKPSPTLSSTPTRIPSNTPTSIKTALSEATRVPDTLTPLPEKLARIIAPIVGKEWKDNIRPAQFSPGFIITFVSEGLFRDKFIVPIGSDDSVEVLAYNIGYYNDAQGKVRQVKIPQLFRLSDGRILVPSLQPPIVKWDDAEITRQIEISSRYWGAEPGGNVWVLITPDVDAEIRSYKAQLPEIAKYALGLIKKYNQDHARLLDLFLKTGDPEIGFLFPTSWPHGVYQKVDLNQK